MPAPNPTHCPSCGISYRKFRTGLKYRDVYHFIWCREYKRRHGVLGYWHQVKLEMWEYHVLECKDVAPF